MTVPDLIGELQRIQAEAKRARERIASGHALNGTTALERIEKQAEDAVRWAQRERAGSAS